MLMIKVKHVLKKPSYCVQADISTAISTCLYLGNVLLSQNKCYTYEVKFQSYVPPFLVHTINISKDQD